MTELVEFLRARYDERERTARAASEGGYAGIWRYDGTDRSGPQLIVGDSEDDVWAREGSPGVWTCDDEQDGCPDVARGWSAEGRHMADHDPAYVLDDLDAKRRILNEHHPVDPCDAHDASLRTIPCDTQLLLALPYAGHPDYRSEWAVAK